jgi:hypothetical protein
MVRSVFVLLFIYSVLLIARFFYSIFYHCFPRSILFSCLLLCTSLPHSLWCCFCCVFSEMEATTLLAGSTTDCDASHAHSASLPTPPSSSSASSALPTVATATGTTTGTIASVSTAAVGHALLLLRTAEGLCVKLVALDQIRAKTKSWTRRALALRQSVALAAPLRE